MKKFKKLQAYLLLSIFSLLLINGCKKETTLSTSIYPDEVPGLTPKPFATNLIVGNPWRIDFRPDGKEFYTVQWVGEEEVKYASQYVKDGQWTTPTNTYLHNSALSTNGKGYFCKNDTLYTFNWSETGQTPDKPCSVIKGGYLWASVANNSNLYLSTNNGDGNWDIYVSKFANDTFQTPVRLSDSINSTQWEQHMFVAADESYIIFDVQTPMANDAMIYVSFRKPDGTWTTRKSLGINGYVSCVAPDGKYLFFKWNQINWVSIDVIEKYRPK